MFKEEKSVWKYNHFLPKCKLNWHLTRKVNAYLTWRKILTNPLVRSSRRLSGKSPGGFSKRERRVRVYRKTSSLVFGWTLSFSPMATSTLFIYQSTRPAHKKFSYIGEKSQQLSGRTLSILNDINQTKKQKLTAIHPLPHVETVLLHSQKMPENDAIFNLETWDIPYNIPYVVKKWLHHR